MKRIFSLLLVAVCAVLSVHAAELTKSYNISATNPSNVLAENRYGNIRVTHWDKKSAEINVSVKITARSESRAQEILSRITITQKEEGGQLSSTTATNSMNTLNGEKVEINYAISLPADCRMKLSQKYGNINLPNTPVDVDAEIDVKYGSLNGGNFNRQLNLRAGYSNVSLDRVDQLNAEIKYCKPVKLLNARVVALEGGYSDFRLGNVEDIKGEIKYSDLEIRSITTLRLDAKYSNATLEVVKEAVNFSGFSYSNLRIEQLKSNFRQVVIPEARYSKVRIKVEGTPAIRFNNTFDKYSEAQISDALKSRSSSSSSAPLIEFSGKYSNIRIEN